MYILYCVEITIVKWYEPLTKLRSFLFCILLLFARKCGKKADDTFFRQPQSILGNTGGTPRTWLAPCAPVPSELRYFTCVPLTHDVCVETPSMFRRPQTTEDVSRGRGHTIHISPFVCQSKSYDFICKMYMHKRVFVFAQISCSYQVRSP